MSTTRVSNVRTLSGEKHARVSVSTSTNAIITGITWHTNYNNTTQTLGNVTGATGSNVKGLILGIYYIHGGGADHGYLAGWYYQTGKTYSTQGVENLQAHYDWYYNYLENLIIIPWDPSGTQSLSITGISAYNTNTNNQYAVYQRGLITQD